MYPNNRQFFSAFTESLRSAYIDFTDLGLRIWYNSKQLAMTTLFNLFMEVAIIQSKTKQQQNTQAGPKQPVSLQALARQIEQQSTLDQKEIMVVLTSLQGVING